MKTPLRQIRKARGLTIDDLTELSGIAKAHISMIERGKRNPSIAALESLARALGVSAQSLMGESVEPEVAPVQTFASLRKVAPAEVVSAHKVMMMLDEKDRVRVLNFAVSLLGDPTSRPKT